MQESTETRRRWTLTAALARLVPPGAGPGAVEAGAVDYVARRIEEGMGGPGVVNGLDLLDRLALDRCGTRFAEIEPLRQDELLRTLEEAPEGKECLRLLVLLALEGSFCHPARGGNHLGVGWRFAGLSDPGLDRDPFRCRAS